MQMLNAHLVKMQMPNVHLGKIYKCICKMVLHQMQMQNVDAKCASWKNKMHI